MKQKIINMFVYLSFIFRPGFWISNYSVCSKWNKKLNQMLDNPRFDIVEYDEDSKMVIRLYGIVLWIGNYPYSYGHSYHLPYSGYFVLPNRLTRIRLKKAIDEFKAKK